jgi:hypothetical protein
MDSFIGRMIRNRYPSWTKIHKDDSSIGAVIFSEVGNEIEKIKSSLYANFKCMSDPLHFGSLTPNKLWVFDFKDFQYYKEMREVMNAYKEIKFFKYVDDLPVELNAFDINYFGKERFFSTYSEEFTISTNANFETENLLLTLNKQTSNDFFDIDFDYNVSYQNRIKFKKAKHLYIKISECNLFYSNSGSSRNLVLEESYYVIIRGYNLLNLPIEETIKISENQIYKTKTKFLCICDISQSKVYNTIGGACLTRHGFNGKVEVLNYPINYDVVKIKSKELVKDLTVKLDDFYEYQNSDMYISNDFNDRSEISYLFKLINNPKVAYNKYNGDVFFNLFSQAILNLDTDEYIQDIEYNYITSKLIGISNKAKLYFFDLGMTAIKAPTLFQNSVEYDISFESMYQKYSLNEEALLIVKHGNVSSVINKIILVCELPDLTIKYVSFDSDFNPILSDTPYVHSVESHPEVEKLWRQFTLKINLDIPGQYNFYSISLNPLDLKKELVQLFSKFEKQETTFQFFKNSIQSYLRTSSNPKGLKINSYSLIAESNTAVYTFDTGISYSSDPLFGIYIDNIDNEIFIVKTINDKIVSVHSLKQKQSSILIDFSNGQFYSFENIDKYKLQLETFTGDIYTYTRGSNA